MNKSPPAVLTPDEMFSLQQSWVETSLGQYLMAKEQAMYDQAVVDLFGFNALQTGFLQMDLLKNSRIPNRFKSSEFANDPVTNLSTNLSFNNLLAGNLKCTDDFLPFADTSLDLLLLPHRLEFSERPHQTLREAARVMMPEGHLLISGFNPYSTWGVMAAVNKRLSCRQSFAKRFPKRLPWCGEFIGLARLKDWLKLLGFEIVSVQMSCHVPPFEQAIWHKRFIFMDELSERCCNMLGGVYFIVAKKRVVGMTPLKPNWKASPLKSALVVKPTQSRPTQSGPSQTSSRPRKVSKRNIENN